MYMEQLDDKTKDDILNHAQRTLYYNELLIQQCNSWLSAEEGNANMIKTIEEKRKKEARISRRNKINSVAQFFGIRKQLKNEN